MKFEVPTIKLTSKYKLFSIGLNPRLQINYEPSDINYFTEILEDNISLNMVEIIGGDFQMGRENRPSKKLVKQSQNENFQREIPQHKVKIKSFYLSQFLITQSQWKAIASLSKVKDSLQLSPSRFVGVDLPVEMVSWEDAIEFCLRLSRATKREYRLPTEAEWEYAARAGTDTAYHYGDILTPVLANYRSENLTDVYYQQTTPVNKFAPNKFGLYDMHGNLWEWCQDDWHENYENAPNDGTAWINPLSMTKVLRGGAWCCHSLSSRSASRWYSLPFAREDFIGFRVVCSKD